MLFIFINGCYIVTIRVVWRCLSTQVFPCWCYTTRWRRPTCSAWPLRFLGFYYIIRLSRTLSEVKTCQLITRWSPDRQAPLSTWMGLRPEQLCLNPWTVSSYQSRQITFCSNMCSLITIHSTYRLYTADTRLQQRTMFFSVCLFVVVELP